MVRLDFDVLHLLGLGIGDVENVKMDSSSSEWKNIILIAFSHRKKQSENVEWMIVREKWEKEDETISYT